MCQAIPAVISHVPLSSSQREVVLSNDKHRLLSAVAGSGKTEVLVCAGIKAFLESKNVIILTKISSVTDEIKERIQKYLPWVSHRCIAWFLPCLQIIMMVLSSSALFWGFCKGWLGGLGLLSSNHSLLLCCQVTFQKQGRSHFIHSSSSASLEVCNFDAMVHHNLVATGDK